MRRHLPTPTQTNPQTVRGSTKMGGKNPSSETFLHPAHLIYLHANGSAYLCIKDFLPLWSQVVLDAVDGSIQGDATDEEDSQNNIRECGCEVHHLNTQMITQADKIILYTSALKCHQARVCVCMCVCSRLTFPEDLTPLMRQRKTTAQDTARHPRIGRRTSPKFPISSEMFNT